MALLCLFGICFAGPVSAEEPLAATDSSPLKILEDDVMAGFAAVEESELSEIRGGEGTVLNLQDLESIVSGNTVEGIVTTGDTMISGNAFSNLDGISSVVINTGNNVSIQSSTVVNIVIEN